MPKDEKPYNEAAAILSCVGEFRCSECPAKNRCKAEKTKPCEQALKLAIYFFEKNNVNL